MKEIVLFFLSGRQYGIEISRMQGLENYTPMAAMDGVNGKFLGIVTIRGEMIPVINVKKCMVLPPAGVTAETKYVVLRTSHGQVAVIVDGVSEIVRIEGEDIQPCPSLIAGDKTEYVDFVARKDDHLVLCVNPDGLLSDSEWAEISRILKQKEAELQNGDKDD